MSYPIDSVGARYVPTYNPPPHNDPAQTAQHILDTGKKTFARDDYDARMVELAKELSKGDATFQREVMTEIMKRDHNALHSWLTPERANNMRASGRITLDEEGAVASGFAAAYNAGDFGTFDQTVGVNTQKGGDLTIKASGLDAWLGSYPTSSNGQNLENATRERQFLDFINTSNSPDTAQFRQQYGKHLLDTYVVNSDFRTQHTEQSDAAAGIAANLLAGDINHPDIAVNALASYTPDQVKTIMEAAGRSNSLYSEDQIRPDANDQHVNARDNSVPNGSALLFDAVALSKSPKADDLAVQFANLPTSSPSLFDPHVGMGAKGNVDGLTLAINGHAKYVFDNLAVYNIHHAPGSDKSVFEVNGAELGTLFKTTLYNQDSTYRNMFQDTITKYAGDNERAFNKDGTNQTAANHISMLAAGLTDGVKQGYDDVAKAQQAKNELFGMVVDIALAGLPAGKWVNKAVEDRLKAAFPDSPKLQDVLNGLSGKLVDTTQGKLSDDAKKQIIDALGSDAGNVEIARMLSDDLTNSFFAGIDASTPEKTLAKQSIVNTYEIINTAIAADRK